MYFLHHCRCKSACACTESGQRRAGPHPRNAARRDLAQSGLKSMVIWALSDNESAVEFYRNLGGRMVARSSERFGGKNLDKVAFSWTH